MNTEVIVSLIALFGVALSVIVALISSRQVTKTELKKHLGEQKQSYAEKLLEKRLNTYPGLYQLTSDFLKLVEYEREKFTNHWLDDFKGQLIDWDSKYALFLSVNSGSKLYSFRRKLVTELLDKMPDDELREKIEDKPYRREIVAQVEQLEIALKNDIGIYVVEFSDFDKKSGDYRKVFRETQKTS
ncbi:MAG: hypothetical protein R2824_08400 [Saprospiraceae bacterium]